MNSFDIEKLKENFYKRNIEVFCFESFEEAKQQILLDIPEDSSVGIGHSETLQRMDLTQLLMDRGNIVYDKLLGTNAKNRKALKKKALISDWFVTGTNAVSIDGRIVNIDHSGNRVAAMLFGPENVIIVVGKNKVVDTVEEAIFRAKNIAAPQNAKRAGYKPPCTILNMCVDCCTEERVCHSLSIIEGQEERGRIRLFLVNEQAGF